MPNCLIIEDEPLAQEVLESYIAEIPNLKLLANCRRAKEAKAFLEKQKVDLIFLDINLPEISGLNFYKTLVNRPKVIFTTAYAEFALDGFELEAVDYLLKPFSFERFEKAIHKLKIDSGSDAGFIMLKADKRMHKVDYEQICYLESHGDFVKVILQEGRSLIISDTLKRLESLLPGQFIRCHKSYIISISKVIYLEGNQIKIKDQMIPIGQSYREKVKQQFERV